MTDHYIDPDRELFDAFKALPRDEPIDMLNLIQFREKAEYPAGHPLADAGMTGAEAYKRYGETSGPIFQRVGGKVIWSGAYQTMVIGPKDKAWDSIFVARYPNSAAFLEMVTDPEYQKAVVNRTAALVTSRLMRLKPRESRGGTFG